jgi:Flp pilus assembly protein TadG
MNWAGAFLKRFLGDRSGSVVQMFTLGVPIIAVLSVGAVELAIVASHKATLQAAADAAVLNGAGQLGIAREGLLERTEAFALRQLNGVGTLSTVTADAEFVDNGVKVSILGVRGSFFGNMLPPGGFKTTVTSTAVSMNGLPLCVLAQRQTGTKVLNLQQSAQIKANGCLVHSNKDVVAEAASSVHAGAVQATGAASGSISPSASVGAPTAPDPFAKLPTDTLKPCTDPGGVKSTAGVTTKIQPGVHCGRWEAEKGAILELQPGEHFFRGAELIIRDNSKLVGRDVVILFDPASKLTFQDQASVDLEGRTTGTYAGFLIVADRQHVRDLEIWSDNVDNLLGVIYAPAAKLLVIGKDEIAEDSDWTVVVAKEIQLKEKAKLTINSNYSSTLVPVPQGVGPSSAGSKLVN